MISNIEISVQQPRGPNPQSNVLHFLQNLRYMERCFSFRAPTKRMKAISTLLEFNFKGKCLLFLRSLHLKYVSSALIMLEDIDNCCYCFMKLVDFFFFTHSQMFNFQGFKKRSSTPTNIMWYANKTQLLLPNNWSMME